MDVVSGSLQRGEILNVGELVTGLLQQSLVYDDAEGLVAVADGQDSTVSALQVESVGGHFLVDIGVPQIQAPVAKGVDGALVACLEHGGSFALIQFRGQGIGVSTGCSGNDGDLDTGLFGISLGQCLPSLIRFGLEVQVVNTAGRLLAAAREQAYNQNQSQENRDGLFHEFFLHSFPSVNLFSKSQRDLNTKGYHCGVFRNENSPWAISIISFYADSAEADNATKNLLGSL